MGYINYAGVPRIIDDVIESTPHVKSREGIKSALQGMLHRYVNGEFSEKITVSEIRNAILKLETKSPHLFVGDEILAQPLESIEDGKARATWEAVAAMRRRKFDGN